MHNLKKRRSYIHKMFLVVLILVLFAVVAFCGHVSIVSDTPSINAKSTKCNMSLYLASHISSRTNEMFLSILFFSLIALTLLIKDKINSNRYKKFGQLPSIHSLFIKTIKLIYKLYNPILEALRKGRLHPQIYSLYV